MFRVRRAHARVVRARLIDYGYAKLFGVGLLLSGYRDMHTIQLAIPVRIEGRFNPQVMMNPIRFKRIDNLSLTILELWKCLIGSEQLLARRRE